MRRWAMLCAVAFCGVSAWAAPFDRAYPEGPQPGWAAEAPTWSVPLPSWSNADPVAVADMVCVTEEPAGLTCLDRATGALRWRVQTPYVATQTGEAAEMWAARVSEAVAAKRAMADVSATYSKLQRDARRGHADAAERLVDVQAELSKLKAAVDLAGARALPADQGIMGYATPTPAVQGTSIVALYAHGVAARYTQHGERLWAVDVGLPTVPMRGYADGHAASPLWVDDVVVVPMGTLRGLDAKTGAVRWTDEVPYADFGTPALAEVEGRRVLITPDGRALDPTDGTVLATGVPPVLYQGPQAHGDMVYVVGNARSVHSAGDKPIGAEAVRLSWEDERLRLTTVWKTTLPSGRLYSRPLLTKDHITVVSASGEVHVVSREDGRLRGSVSLTGDQVNLAVIYPSPIAVGDARYVAAESGVVIGWEGSPLPIVDADTIASRPELPPFRSTPVVLDGAIYVRTMLGLAKFGP